METIFLDNAATTALDPAVKQAMIESFEDFGNPSSVHRLGREAKSKVEQARKNIAEMLGIVPAQLFFTSGATEAINTAIFGTLCSYPEVKTIITSPLEHDAVLACTKECAKNFSKELKMVNVSEKGEVDLSHLEELLSKAPHSLVCLMYANNEIGNIANVNSIGALCAEHQSYYLCDTVAAMGHVDLNIGELPVHYACATPHKFHGPKGVGLLVVKDMKIFPRQFGGGQEMNMRAGTENIYGIIGMEKALEIAVSNLKEDMAKVQSLKSRVIERMKTALQLDYPFYGDIDNSVPTILNLKLPVNVESEILVYSLDIENILVSAGSACSSGSSKSSHVITALNKDIAEPHSPSLRVSFSKFNTEEEIDRFCEVLLDLVERFK